MRIAFFADAYRPRVSGLVSSIDEFCTELTARGHDVCIVCPSYPASRMAGVVEPFLTIRVPSTSGMVSREDRLALTWPEGEVLDQVDAFNPDIVHIQTEFSLGNLGRRYCRSRGLPVLSTCHTHYEMYMKSYFSLIPEKVARKSARLFIRRTYSRDDFIITPSQEIRRVLESYGIDRNFVVIPTGVNDAFFKPGPEAAAAFKASLERDFPRAGAGPLLLYIGRIGEEKNLPMLMDAFEMVLAEVPEARLLLVGDGPWRAEGEAAGRARGLGDRLIWKGYMSRDLLPAVYSAADLFTFPSATETQGLVTIEAMLCGTPVVGVNRMGTAEIMAGDKGGLLAEDEAADFARKVVALLKDPVLRAAKREEALAHARQWSIAHACTRLEALYRSLISH